MAGSSLPPSRSSSLANTSVSQEEFNVFHAIDRKLFSRLVFNLGRDPAEATQIMALWLWLEMVDKEIDMVYSKLLSLPDTLLNELVEESVVALACIESNIFPFASESVDSIPLIKNLTKTGVSLRFFHDNRIGIIQEVTKITNEVCLRAFEDIVKLAQGISENNTGIGGELGHFGKGAQNFKPFNFYGSTMNPFLPVWNYNSSSGIRHPHMGALPYLPLHVSGGVPSETSQDFDPYDLSVQRKFLNSEMISEVLSQIKLSTDEEEKEKDVPPDERTIFLTFSKGYPISEYEIREFFTRKFGDFIEAIHMQEVLLPVKQPLYARLVVRLASSITEVLDGKNKANFSINGKHVRARKYLRKNPRSPQKSSPPSTSRPTSPENKA
ncbi:hypothetical protein F2P56_017028 [Juglans regia]|uniref:Uncharacterized protein n=2 Tax=Juglans regia TaxID=51240 RepID=A0A833XIR3_JUGRE|nr:uncharacterized protein LOC108997052 [Juglans regia]KAF5467173.1 hypothetical protein F2P56_017028 [Juglans regia]